MGKGQDVPLFANISQPIFQIDHQKGREPTMATEVDQQSVFTDQISSQLLPQVFSVFCKAYGDAISAKNLSNMRRVNKACRKAINKHIQRLSIKLNSKSDCILAANFLEEIGSIDNNLGYLKVVTSINRNHFGVHAVEDNENETAAWTEAFRRPLEVIATTQWMHLQTLKIQSDNGEKVYPFKELTAENFPNLEHLKLQSNVANDVYLSLPKLLSLKIEDATLDPDGINSILYEGHNLPCLVSLDLDNVEGMDWTGATSIAHQHLKELRISVEFYDDTELGRHLRRDSDIITKLEELYIESYSWESVITSNPIKDIIVGLEFPQLKHLSLKFNVIPPASLEFIAMARACPNLESLDLSETAHESKRPSKRAKAKVVNFFKALAQENTRAPLLPNLQEIDFPDQWVRSSDRDVIIAEARKIWPRDRVVIWGGVPEKMADELEPIFEQARKFEAEMRARFGF